MSGSVLVCFSICHLRTCLYRASSARKRAELAESSTPTPASPSWARYCHVTSEPVEESCRGQGEGIFSKHAPDRLLCGREASTNRVLSFVWGRAMCVAVEPCRADHGTVDADQILQPRGPAAFTRELLTPTEVATELRVTAEQIRSLIRRGELAAINVGAGAKRPLYRIRRQALNEFLARRWHSAPAAKPVRVKRHPCVRDHFPDLQ
jgi:excisionase family DNA binding protein